METFHSNQTCILWQLHLKIPPMWAGKEKAIAEVSKLSSGKTNRPKKHYIRKDSSSDECSCLVCVEPEH